jgi:tRNA uridine 5-carboxymethylaminomethyl modification enzyme
MSNTLNIKDKKQKFDVIVIGGGHAGTEAACAAARMGASTLLLTHKKETIGVMSCNPAIGGLGKGHLVREIDALDGVMGRVIDEAGIQFRMLNSSKGAAVQGPRAQADRKLYREAMQKIIFNYPNLTVIADGAEDLLMTDARKIYGVRGTTGTEYLSAAVVITTGTFLRGVVHRGETTFEAGRIGEAPAKNLSRALEKLNLPLGRLKTGTPARLDGTTIDWTKCEEQKGDETPIPFSFLNQKISVPQISCYITYTSPETHALIKNNLHRAPMYSGQISSSGPRYCPSIEDKIVRFADKERHQIFLEPEGLDDNTVYPNGISTSLPIDVQDALIRSIKGLENVKIIEYGYAIEYDYVDPRALSPTLAVKNAQGLFLAGQINGTTGYEEAAGQGLIAGLNAALFARAENPRAENGCAENGCAENHSENHAENSDKNNSENNSGARESFILDRGDGYLGVMIDDLITQGVSEPYRMFTSRAEYRLRLRADNADQRLTPLGIALGCVGDERRKIFEEKMTALDEARVLVQSLKKSPHELSQLGIKINQDGIKRSAFDLLAFPEIDIAKLSIIFPEISKIAKEIQEQIVIDAKYAGYLEQQDAEIRAFRRDEKLKIPSDFNYAEVGSLSNEVRTKLERARPETLGAASRIQGITPAALISILRFVKKADRNAA